MKEYYFKYIFQKKIRKENKTNTKIKRTSKRNAPVLTTFKLEGNAGDLERAIASFRVMTYGNQHHPHLAKKLIRKWKMRNKVALISGMQIQVNWKEDQFWTMIEMMINMITRKIIIIMISTIMKLIMIIIITIIMINQVKQKQKDKGTSLKCFISNASYQLCIPSDHEYIVSLHLCIQQK